MYVRTPITKCGNVPVTTTNLSLPLCSSVADYSIHAGFGDSRWPGLTWVTEMNEIRLIGCAGSGGEQVICSEMEGGIQIIQIDITLVCCLRYFICLKFPAKEVVGGRIFV